MLFFISSVYTPLRVLLFPAAAAQHVFVPDALVLCCASGAANDNAKVLKFVPAVSSNLYKTRSIKVFVSSRCFSLPVLYLVLRSKMCLSCGFVAFAGPLCLSTQNPVSAALISFIA